MAKATEERPPAAVPGWSALRLVLLLAAGLAFWAVIIWALVTL